MDIDVNYYSIPYELETRLPIAGANAPDENFGWGKVFRGAPGGSLDDLTWDWTLERRL
jgi:hypothetical protein